MDACQWPIVLITARTGHVPDRHSTIELIRRVALILLILALMTLELLPQAFRLVSTASDEWFTLPQIAEMLGVNPSTVRHWVNTGRLSAEKRGRRWLVERADLDTIMAQRRRRAGRSALIEPPAESGEQRKGLSMADSIDLSNDT